MRLRRLSYNQQVMVALAILLALLAASFLAQAIHERSPAGIAARAVEERDRIDRERTAQAEADRELSRMFTDADLEGVKFWLRDPESAIFRGVTHFERAGKTVTCGSVNSRNGFGGMAGWVRFSVVDGAANVGGISPRIDDAIQKACS